MRTFLQKLQLTVSVHIVFIYIAITSMKGLSLKYKKCFVKTHVEI